MIYENIIKLLKFRVNKVNKLFFGKIYVKVYKRENLQFTLASCSLICYQLRKLQVKKTTPDSDIFGLSVIAKTIAFVSN